MVTPTEFFIELVNSTVELTRIFATDVAVSDPLSAISFLVGALITAGSVVIFGGLVLGAVGDLLGVSSPR